VSQVIYLHFIRLAFVLSIFALTTTSIFSQTTTTNLKDPNHIQIFLDVTQKIRCICLPSLPIQACSFNMCSASAYLKNFIENQINAGMNSDEIVYKMEHGFGDSILKDSVVLHFQETGNQGMIDSLVYGFGDKILAKPDSTWINLTLIFLGVLGLTGITLYFKIFKKKVPSKIDPTNTHTTEEIQKKIKDWENSV